MKLPILPTAIVGSYAMPGWLERLKTEYFARRISRHDLDEIHDAALQHAAAAPGLTWLDIGAGNGAVLSRVRDHYSPSRLVAIDIIDNGKGFPSEDRDSETAAITPGWSLTSMRNPKRRSFRTPSNMQGSPCCI